MPGAAHWWLVGCFGAVCLVAVLAMAVLVWWGDHGLMTRVSPPMIAAPMIVDTPEVRRLIAEQATRDTEMGKPYFETEEQNKSLAGRRKFVEAMLQQPHILVPEKVYLREMEQSGAYCALDSWVENSAYFKLQITTGPQRGQTGWMCEEDFFRTVTLPQFRLIRPQ